MQVLEGIFCFFVALLLRFLAFWVFCFMALRIGVADTTFARADLAHFAVSQLESSGENLEIVRVTVPGVKDLPVACKKLVEKQGCAVVMALGMPGPKAIDKMCAHEASMGLIQAQLLTNTHIVEVFVHEDEASSPRELIEICRDRSRKHAKNALALCMNKAWLSSRAGLGKRQGKEDAGPVAQTHSP